MATSIKLMMVLIVLFSITVYARCTKDVLGCNEAYGFVIDAKIYPDKDSINIGDTIFAAVSFPTTPTDQSGQKHDFSHANNIGTALVVVKLINVSPINLQDAADDFAFKVFNGNELSNANPKGGRKYSFKEADGLYTFKVAVIPKVSGTYSLNFVNASGVYRNGNPCPKAGFFFQLFNTTNQHYYLYPPAVNVTPGGADYWFYVR